MKLLNEYFKLQKEIHDYFGYVEDWVFIPLHDDTAYYWTLTEDEVIFWESEEEFRKGEFYSYEIYTQRFLPKWVYEGEDYTMIVSDTQMDNNKCLAVFDNKKKEEDTPEEIY